MLCLLWKFMMSRTLSEIIDNYIIYEMCKFREVLTNDIFTIQEEDYRSTLCVSEWSWKILSSVWNNFYSAREYIERIRGYRTFEIESAHMSKLSLSRKLRLLYILKDSSNSFLDERPLIKHFMCGVLIRLPSYFIFNILGFLMSYNFFILPLLKSQVW